MSIFGESGELNTSISYLNMMGINRMIQALRARANSSSCNHLQPHKSRFMD